MSRDRGQAVVVLVVLVAVCALGIAAVLGAGGALMARSSAAAAADAVALGVVALDGAEPAIDVARRLAAANGAELVAVERVGVRGAVTVTVTVRVRGVRAVARATNAP